MEIKRETFVSKEMKICREEVGRYGVPPKGTVALEHPADVVIHCQHKVNTYLYRFVLIILGTIFQLSNFYS